MAQRLPAARESVPYYRTWALTPNLLQGAVDITGWSFKLALAHDNVASPSMTLGMAGTALAQGFAVISGPNLLLTIRILPAALTAVPDTTGDFELFGDLLATPPGSDSFFVTDLILPVTKGPTTP